MSKLIYFGILLFTKLTALIYQAEGINIALKIMPTRFVAPILEKYGAKIGKNVRFKAPLTIHNAAIKPLPFFKNLIVDQNCYLGRELFLDIQDQVLIEHHVTISHQVTILTHTDVGESPLKNDFIKPSQASVTIRQGAYIGARATILPGIEIGECAVVGAGAVVTKNVPALTVVAGVPAKIIKTLSN